jgi:hypothetical protein
VKRGGRYLDPGQLKVPRDAPVRPEWLPAYHEAIAPLAARLAEPVALN